MSWHPKQLVASLAVLFPLLSTGAGDSTWSSHNCTAFLSPDSVAIHAEPVTVTYAAPDSIGAVTSITAPNESGIEVQTLDDASKSVTLATVSATVGQWPLTLTGDSARTCVGMLKVFGVRPTR